MRLLPRYRLHEQVCREPLSHCLDSLAERIAANRHFEFFWYPTDDQAFTKTLNPTDRPPTPPAAEPVSADRRQRRPVEARKASGWTRAGESSDDAARIVSTRWNTPFRPSGAWNAFWKCANLMRREAHRCRLADRVPHAGRRRHFDQQCPRSRDGRHFHPSSGRVALSGLLCRRRASLSPPRWPASLGQAAQFVGPRSAAALSGVGTIPDRAESARSARPFLERASSPAVRRLSRPSFPRFASEEVSLNPRLKLFSVFCATSHAIRYLDS